MTEVKTQTKQKTILFFRWRYVSCPFSLYGNEVKTNIGQIWIWDEWLCSYTAHSHTSNMCVCTASFVCLAAYDWWRLPYSFASSRIIRNLIRRGKFILSPNPNTNPSFKLCTAAAALCRSKILFRVICARIEETGRPFLFFTMFSRKYNKYVDICRTILPFARRFLPSLSLACGSFPLGLEIRSSCIILVSQELHISMS